MPTPIILIFGQSNAAFLNNSNAIETACAGEGVTITEVTVAAGSRSVSLPDGDWNIITGDGEDAPGALYVQLLNDLAAFKLATPDAYIAGAVWVQGEQDTASNQIGNHYIPLTALFTQMRIDLAATYPEASTFPILIQGLSDYQSLNVNGRAYVRAVQQQVASEMADVYYIDTDAVIATHNLTPAEVMADTLHYKPAFFGHMAERYLEEPALRSTLGLDPDPDPDPDPEDELIPTPGFLIIEKAPGAGSITTPGGQTLTTQNYGSAPPPPPSATAYPRLTGVQRMGETITLDDSMLTNVTARSYYLDGLEIAGATGQTVMAMGMGLLSCTVVADGGTYTTPAMRILHSHTVASHNAADNAVLALGDHGLASHIAVADGSWSDPATWDVAMVPGDDARVLIPTGMEVTYDAAIAPRLKTVRADGVLRWALDRSTNMLVETLITQPMGGKMIIGDAVDNRLPASHTAQITISNRNFSTDAGPTDIDLAADPTLHSRGILNLGEMTLFGKEIETWVRTAPASLPKAGDTSLTLEHAPQGWQVGDIVVVPGTASNIAPQTTQYFGGTNIRYDEERVVTGIADNVVSFAAALVNDHDGILGPLVTDRPDLKLPIAVKTRNIIIRSEAGAAVHQRGHVMSMHMPSKTDVWGVAFLELGRTDKSKPAGQIEGSGDFRFVPIGTKAFSTETLTGASNIQGRYAMHLHIVGFKKAFTDLVRDCYTEDNKGWANVHHGCQSDWTRNVIYRFQGAGLVGETGDELGEWDENLVFGLDSTCAVAGHPKGQEEKEGLWGDRFRRGYAFAWSGRAMISTRNIACGAAWGFNFYHRSAPTGLGDTVDNLRKNVDLHDVGWLLDNPVPDCIGHVDYPIIHFEDNEAIGCFGGVAVIKSLSQQGHDYNIIFGNFKAWGVIHGLGLDYIGTYALQNIDLIATVFRGQQGNPGANQFAGITGTKTNQISYMDVVTRGFRNGIRFDISQPPTGGNENYDNDLHPKHMILRHTSIDDEFARDGTTTDWEIYNKYFPDNLVLQERPSVTLPLIIGDYVGHNAPFENTVGGTKQDSVSNAGPLPKGYDSAGLLFGGPNGGQQTPGAMARRCLEIQQLHGYHTYEGQPVLAIPLYVSDRLSATPIKVTRLIRLMGNVAPYSNNGALTRSAADPMASSQNLSLAMTQDTTLTFNAITAASVTGAAGTTLTLGDPYMTALFGGEPAHKKPNYGKLEVSENGDNIYNPKRNFVGQDTWVLFVYDGQMRWLTIEVTVDVQAA